jgi:hypothetical protein
MKCFQPISKRSDAVEHVGRHGHPGQTRARWVIAARHLLIGAVITTGAGTCFAIPIDGGVEGPVPDVFYNFYTPPVPVGAYPAMGAQLYVSPRPVPPRVGHTWSTYPPFAPHEFLYKHRRKYVRPAGVTGMRTTVHGYWW